MAFIGRAFVPQDDGGRDDGFDRAYDDREILRLRLRAPLRMTGWAPAGSAQDDVELSWSTLNSGSFVLQDDVHFGGSTRLRPGGSQHGNRTGLDGCRSPDRSSR